MDVSEQLIKMANTAKERLRAEGKDPDDPYVVMEQMQASLNASGTIVQDVLDRVLKMPLEDQIKFCILSTTLALKNGNDTAVGIANMQNFLCEALAAIDGAK